MSPQNGNAFIRGFQSNDTLDTSIQAISDRITIEPYISRLAARIPGFTFKPYTAAQIFTKNDFTFRGTRLYQWIKATSGSNVDPLTAGNYADPSGYLDSANNANASWLVASPSLQGAGTSTNELVYEQSAFEALTTNPASRKNLNELRTNILANVSAPNLTAYARKDQQNSFTALQAFGAGATVPDLAAGDNSSAVANTRTVRAILAGSGGLSLLNRISILEERRNQGISLAGVAGVNVRVVRDIQSNSGDINSVDPQGVISIKPGTYLLWGSAISNRTNGSKLAIWNNTENNLLSSRSISGFAGSNLGNSSAQNVENTLMDLLTFTATTSITFRHILETGGADALGLASNRSGYSELYARLMFFRLS
ncbi:MAG: hypothetical protein ACRDBG_22555 [Waterburya sp.]